MLAMFRGEARGISCQRRYPLTFGRHRGQHEFCDTAQVYDTITAQEAHHRLKPTLSWPHLVAMGVGAIVGTGIYTLTGIGAGLAGPGVMLSFLFCGILCGCAALCYAEMAVMMPAAGSAYTYSYAVLGELLAWIVGWSLVLEYTVAAAAVAVGWSAHVGEFIQAEGWQVPVQLLQGFEAGGWITFRPSSSRRWSRAC